MPEAINLTVDTAVPARGSPREATGHRLQPIAQGGVLKSPELPPQAQETPTPTLSTLNHPGNGDGRVLPSRVIGPVIDPPEQPPRGRFLVFQSWEGTVLRVSGQTFWARLYDRTTDARDEEAEFFLDDVSVDDLPLLAPGAVFYWSVGYFDSPTRERSRQSLLRFRRLPAWSRKDIARLQARVAEAIGETDDSQTDTAS